MIGEMRSSLPLAFALLVVTARVVLAQDAVTVETGNAAATQASSFSWPDGWEAAIARALLGGLPAAIGSWLGEGIQAILRAVWDGLARVFGPINVFTQLPDLWTYNLPAVGVARTRLAPIAARIVTLGIVATVALAGLGTLVGRPFGWLLSRFPTILLAAGGLVAAPTLTKWWVDVCNALSGALLDPITGLPGLSAMTAVGQLVTLGWVAFLYLGFALVFLFARLKLLVYAALCIAVAPLAIAAGAIPLPRAQGVFEWWLTTFLGVTVVQVLQAVCLGIGANILVVGGANSDGAGELMAGLVGAGAILAAGTVPKLVLGRLAPAAGTGLLGGAVQAATMLAGFGVAGAVAKGGFTWVQAVAPAALGAGVPGGGAVVTQVGRVGSGYVRSILAGAPTVPMLPPPRG